jgi:RAB6A-GEF complex partner protein 1
MLENSLWGYDGQSLRVWLNALAIEAPLLDDSSGPPENVKESVNIPLDFYPLCERYPLSLRARLDILLAVLMDKGIIIGAEHEAASRMNLSFVMFRQATSVSSLHCCSLSMLFIFPQSHLFLHHILLYHLGGGEVRDAVTFASHYQHLVFFAHALEILLHTTVEAEAGLESSESSSTSTPERVLPTVVAFLDHFDAALDVVVGCARKTEMSRWRRLFDVVGNPKALFEVSLFV